MVRSIPLIVLQWLTEIIASSFKKHSVPVLRADTQFTVVEASLKGYNKWVAAHGKTPQQDVGIWAPFLYDTSPNMLRLGTATVVNGKRSGDLGHQLDAAQL